MPKNIGFAGEKQSDLAKNGLERAINRFKKAKIVLSVQKKHLSRKKSGGKFLSENNWRIQGKIRQIVFDGFPIVNDFSSCP